MADEGKKALLDKVSSCFVNGPALGATAGIFDISITLSPSLTCSLREKSQPPPASWMRARGHAGCPASARDR